MMSINSLGPSTTTTALTESVDHTATASCARKFSPLQMSNFVIHTLWIAQQKNWKEDTIRKGCINLSASS
jgi:hypothetical protein